jgi:hypothetical protein
MSMLNRYERAALRQLLILGAVEPDTKETFRIARSDLIVNDEVSQVVLMELLRKIPGGSEAMHLLTNYPAATPLDVGRIICTANSADWKTVTIHSVGKNFRSWARHAGISTVLRQQPEIERNPSVEPDMLFEI